MRRWLVRRLRVESPWMADMQKRYRTSTLDTYFFWTAIFGTHTFFMTVLPLFFFFGDHQKGRGLLYVTGLGIYASSYAKDLACAPRPYSPPVVRLSMSTHGLEYGFPSSHSTNSTSIALFLASWLASSVNSIGYTWMAIGMAVLTIYAASVIFGRLYCGMHSAMDCIAGTIMGWLCWLLWEYAAPMTDKWIESGGWHIPFVLIPACLLLVHKHPEPVDNCPCFEDAIAILSVMLGSMLAHWTAARIANNAGVAYRNTADVLHGSPFGLEGMMGTLVMISMSVLKIAVGLSIIFAWRLVTKKTMHLILPSIFRNASKLFEFTLPTRKHYKAATDYTSVPPETSLRSIPSFIDLPSEEALASALPETAGNLLRSRGRSLSGANKRPDNLPPPTLEANGEASLKSAPVSGKLENDGSKEERSLPHYDVDVLTKVVVYGGIGYGATYLIPIDRKSVV